MVTALLTMAVVWCLFYGRMPGAALALLCVVLGVALAVLGRHGLGQSIAIDVLAQTSRLKRVNSTLKFWTALILMGLCISSGNPAPGVCLAVLMLIFTVYGGGIALHDYVRLLALPVSFLLLGGLALLFEVTAQRTGVLGFSVLGYWFCVGRESQTLAALVMARALGALGSLYFLSLTTPVAELIGVLRRMRCPEILIELMYLIYRYIFILLSMYHTMRDAAASRLGFVDYRASMRTTGNLYVRLLYRSYRQAGRNFDAMESRCYESGIRFLERQEKVTAAQAAVSVGTVFLILCMTLLFR